MKLIELEAPLLRCVDRCPFFAAFAFHVSLRRSFSEQIGCLSPDDFLHNGYYGVSMFSFFLLYHDIYLYWKTIYKDRAL